jgi:hypothetical protein
MDGWSGAALSEEEQQPASASPKASAESRAASAAITIA